MSLLSRRARAERVVLSTIAVLVSASLASAQWVDFADETSTRLSAAAAVGETNPDEKDYAWGDVDNDGDIDLVAVYKSLGTSTGRRANVLFINESGVLTDRTALFGSASAVTLEGGATSQGLLDLTNDRDVALADFNGDGWLDIVTATTLSGGAGGTVGDKAISHPRIYINLGDSPPGSGNWLGFAFDDVDRIPTFAAEPRFCAVSVGDVDDDGDLDVYFGDYQQGGARAVDLNDRLIMNDGTGYFVDESALRMTAEMTESSFGMSTAIADMNGDGRLDIIKDDALNAPQGISISYNNNAGAAGMDGMYDAYEVAYAFTPYHVAVGDLNNDNRMDLVITDDGLDYYSLNSGNGADGLANFAAREVLNGSVSEFGGNNIIIDLNNDGFNDVIVTSVDVDLPSCTTSSRIYRNLGDLPDVTISQQGTVGINPTHLQGGHDVAVFDINGDGWNDLVIGTCNGTTVYINQPPAGLTFSFPAGLPVFVPPGEPYEFDVQVTGVGASIPAGDTGVIIISQNGGAFTPTAMTHLGGDLYRATLPAAPCIDAFAFYFSAEDTTSAVFNDPPGGASAAYESIVALGTAQSFRDDIEGSVAAWTVVNDPSLTAGGWEAAIPIGTNDGGNQAAPSADAEASTSAVRAFVTQNCPSTPCAAGAFDVDGGPTDLLTPTFDLAGTDATISYFRWFYTDSDDVLNIAITNNASAPTPTWVTVEDVTETTNGINTAWQAATLRVGDYVTPTGDVQLRFRVDDAGVPSITEAGIDLVQVDQFVCNDDCLTDADCDLDGLFCTADVCISGSCSFGGNPCPGQFCDDMTDACVNCLVDSDCEDGLFCTVDVCLNGSCGSGGDPCAAGLTCDEAGDACVGCVVDGDCDDGNICNGAEVCSTGTCITPGPNGVVNGGFADNTAWIDNIPADGTITYGGMLTVVGPDGGTGSVTWASQSGVDLAGADLEFDLLSWSPTDTGAWDRPVVVIDGTYYGLDADGTVGTVATIANGAFGDIDNGTPVAVPIHFAIDVEALAGTGPHEIGFGVLSADGQVGEGTAVFDNAAPAAGGPVDPCPGQLCDPGLGCVDCLVAADCDDGAFCNGAESCASGSCAAGADPCPGLSCDEALDACIGCLVDGDCDDGVFCNGAETCQGGDCVAGSDPCPGQSCDEGSNSCLGCLTDADCNTDGLFCTNDLCTAGSCTIGPDPCPGQICDEAGDGCVDCLADADCDDGLFCTTDVCVTGACTTGGDSCPGQICNDIRDTCVDCLSHADCGAGFCCDNTCQAQACVLALQPKPGDPLPDLTAMELARFEAGLLAFDRVFTAGEGLGPIFNQNSCASCHNNPVGGSGSITVTRFGIGGGKGGAFDPLSQLGGSLLQAQAISLDCAEQIPASATVVATRATPSLLGFGLIEVIPDAAILAGASTGSGVSGKARMVPALEDPMGSPLHVARFGWKADHASVLSFSADAALNEMGITNRLLDTENDPNGVDPPALGAPDNCDTVADPEDAGPIGSAFIDEVTDFQRFLAPPPQTPKSGMSGEVLFASVGCAVCHTPSFVTPDDAGLPDALRDRTARVYSDFLLHDMGLLFDGIVSGDAEAAEIRTPPLWGLRLRDPMLHDASVQGGSFEVRVNQAIVAHGQLGSEAKPAVDAFLALSGPDQAAVVAFLGSLGRCEFDDNADGVVNHEDYAGFLACFTGPGSFYTPDDPCSVHDIDCDGDVDDVDRSFFLVATEDCCDLNGNGIRDDVCTWCDNGVAGCDYVTLAAFADMGGSFGTCPPDGFVNVHDRNHALTCFAGVNPCDAINIDAGGAFGDCVPDGFCNIHDANHALAAFAGTSTCTCPAGPAPEFPADAVATARLRLTANHRTVSPGEDLMVRVFLDTPLADLRAYQLDLGVRGGEAGALELIGIAIEPRKDGALRHRADHFEAFNVANGQMLQGLDVDLGEAVPVGAYLATYTYRATGDASGRFAIDLRATDPGHQTFLIASGDARVAIERSKPLEIRIREVGPRR